MTEESIQAKTRRILAEMAAKTAEEMTRIAEVVRAHRFRFNSEIELQRSIGDLLRSRGFDLTAEARLSATSRPDFLTGAGIAIEIKIKGSRNALLRQIQRYMQHGEVQGVIVLSPKHLHVDGLPAFLSGLPVRGVRLVTGEGP